MPIFIFTINQNFCIDKKSFNDVHIKFEEEEEEIWG